MPRRPAAPENDTPRVEVQHVGQPGGIRWPADWPQPVRLAGVDVSDDEIVFEGAIHTRLMCDLVRMTIGTHGRMAHTRLHLAMRDEVADVDFDAVNAALRQLMTDNRVRFHPAEFAWYPVERPGTAPESHRFCLFAGMVETLSRIEVAIIQRLRDLRACPITELPGYLGDESIANEQITASQVAVAVHALLHAPVAFLMRYEHNRAGWLRLSASAPDRGELDRMLVRRSEFDRDFAPAPVRPAAPRPSLPPPPEAEGDELDLTRRP